MIKIIGPRDKRDRSAINTTSHSPSDWTTGLSPFHLGPIQLYQNDIALIFENAWQFTKLYPEHADTNGEPTAKYWQWANAGWASTRPHRYPMGKGRRPLCSLWNGQRLGYVDARQQIYLPLYQQAVKQTNAYARLQRLYQKQGSLTLFDFDGYDHLSLGMNLKDVLNSPTRICGHAFILAIMLIHGTDFKVENLPDTDDLPAIQKAAMFPITVVNKKTFTGPSEYIGRTMRNLNGSPLGNPFRVKPHGPYTREASVLKMYRQWLWEQMQNTSGPVYRELLRLAGIALNEPLTISCWCAPELCHGDVIKRAIEFLITNELVRHANENFTNE